MTNHNSPVSTLRQRMLEDMQLRKLGAKTQSSYIRAVKNLSDFLHRSPASADAEDLRRFQLHLATTGTSPTTINATLTGLRFFFTVTLERAEVMSKTSAVFLDRKLPVVPSVEEVARLLEHAPGAKYQAALSLAYGTGLRAGEVIALKVGDIDSERMLIRVDQGKGRRDRNAMLSPTLLNVLRAWWHLAHAKGRMLPGGWLFPGQNPVNPMSTRQLNRACHAAVQRAGINKRVSMHTLRHSFATHLLEDKADIRIIQVLLGHAKLNTTALYSQVATRTLRDVRSPLDKLKLKKKPPN